MIKKSLKLLFIFVLFNINTQMIFAQKYEAKNYVHSGVEIEQEEKRLLNQSRITKNIFRKFLDKSISLSSDKPILEAGCGVGANTPFIAQILPNKHIVGIDIEKNHINRAEVNLSKNNFISYSLSQENLIDLPYFSNYFSAAFVIYVLEHLNEQDVVLALKELKRVVEKSGYLFIIEGIVSSCDVDDLPITKKYLQKFVQVQSKYGNADFGKKDNFDKILSKVGFTKKYYSHKIVDYLVDQKDFLSLLESASEFVGKDLFEDVKKEVIKSNRNLFTFKMGFVTVKNKD